MINNFNSKKDKQFEVHWFSIIYVTRASMNFLIKTFVLSSNINTFKI